MKDPIKENREMSEAGNGSERIEINLLNISWLRQLILWNGFPYIFQMASLVIFLLLIFFGWKIYTPENVNDKLFAKSHLVTLFVWGIWWPVMVWIAVSMGRVWCMICPLELVSNITERISRSLGVRQKALSKWISNGAFIVALYSIIQLLVAGIQIHRVPAYTSFMLTGLLAVSAAAGFLFRDRAFCRGFCPIGMLLNSYGRGGMISVRRGSGCSECSERTCTEAKGRYRADGRSCPSLLNPSNLNSNMECLVCCQCIKSCSKDNMQLLLRRPFEKNNARTDRAGWALTVFIIIASGFVTYELAAEWKPAQEIFLYIPVYIIKEFGLKESAGLIKGFWSICIFPLLLWGVLCSAAKFWERTNPVRNIVREMALPLVIIISAGHITKGLAKLNSWISFLPGSLNDPSGMAQTAAAAAGISTPGAILPVSIISLIGISIMAISLFYSIREERLNFRSSHFRIIPKLILTALYSVIILGMGA